MSYPDPRFAPPQYQGQQPHPYPRVQPLYPPGWPDAPSPDQDSQPHWDQDTQVQPLYGGPTGQPPVPPAAARRKRTYLIAGTVAAVVVLGGGTLALASGGGNRPATVPLAGATARPSTTPAGSAATVPSTPASPSRQRSATTQRALISWLTRGGQARLDALGNDFEALQRASQDNAPPAAVKTACTALKRDVASAQRYAPIPDRIAQGYWRAALAHYASGARDCVSAAAALTRQAMLTAAKEMQAGTQALQKVSDRLKSLG